MYQIRPNAIQVGFPVYPSVTTQKRPTMREFVIESLQRIGRFEAAAKPALARLADRAHVRHVPDEQAVIHEDDEGRHVYLVAAGVFKIFNSDPDGNVALSSIALPGDIVGEVAAVDGAGRSASVVSSGLSQVLNLGTPATIAEVLGPESTYRLMSCSVCEKLRDLTALHQVIVCRDSVETMRAITRTIVGRNLRVDRSVRAIELSLTQKDLSQMTGYSRETVNRAFRTIYRDSIQFSGSRMRISADIVARHLEREEG